MHDQSNRSAIILILVGILVGASGLFLLTSYVFNKAKQTPEPEVFGATGTLHISLAERGHWDVDLFALDIASGEMRRNGVSDEYTSYTDTVSHDGTMRAFMAAPIDPDKDASIESPQAEPFELYIEDLKTGALTKVTEAAYRTPTLPQWSPNDRYIAFEYRTSDSFEDLVDNDTLAVAVYDRETGELREIGAGAHPLWSPDGSKLLTLRSDGLYLYDVSGGNGKKVYEAVRTTSTLLKSALSRDGSQFAITNPEGVFVFRITSWNDFAMERIATLALSEEEAPEGAAYRWPVFSPDDTYIAVHAGVYADGKRISPRITVFDIETGEYRNVADLSSYNNSVTFISDWN